MNWGRFILALLLLVMVPAVLILDLSNVAYNIDLQWLLLFVTSSYAFLAVTTRYKPSQTGFRSTWYVQLERIGIGQLSLLYFLLSTTTSLLGIYFTFTYSLSSETEILVLPALAMIPLIIILSFLIPSELWSRTRLFLIVMIPFAVLHNLFLLLFGQISGGFMALLYLLVLIPLFSVLLASNAHFLVKEGESTRIGSKYRLPILTLVFMVPILLVYVLTIWTAFDSYFTGNMIVLALVLLPLSVGLASLTSFGRIRKLSQIGVGSIYSLFFMSMIDYTVFEWMNQVGESLNRILGYYVIESGSFLIIEGIPAPILTGFAISLLVRYWRSREILSDTEIELYPQVTPRTQEQIIDQ